MLGVGLGWAYFIVIFLVVGDILRQGVDFASCQPLLLGRFGFPINGLIVSTISI